MIFLYNLLLISITVLINSFKLLITHLSHMNLFFTLFFNSQQYIIINVLSFYLNNYEVLRSSGRKLREDQRAPGIPGDTLRSRV